MNSLQSGAGLLVLGSMILKLYVKSYICAFFFWEKNPQCSLEFPKKKVMLEKHTISIIRSALQPFIPHTHNLCPTLCQVLWSVPQQTYHLCCSPHIFPVPCFSRNSNSTITDAYMNQTPHSYSKNKQILKVVKLFRIIFETVIHWIL